MCDHEYGWIYLHAAQDQTIQVNLKKLDCVRIVGVVKMDIEVTDYEESVLWTARLTQGGQRTL